MTRSELGVGFIGSGFVTKFHLQAWRGVRDADVRGIYSPNTAHAEATAALARELRVGDARAFKSIQEMIAAPEIDCVWICGPNHERVSNMNAICQTIESGTAKLIGVACEKPLARNVAEARRMVELVEKSGLLHGYLEDQIFAPSVTRGKEIMWSRAAALTGRPYLARAAEEHSGPHSPWFWRGELQGGGVLNDMMCHSIEVARYMLTKPGAQRSAFDQLRCRLKSPVSSGLSRNTQTNSSKRWEPRLIIETGRPKTLPARPSITSMKIAPH